MDLTSVPFYINILDAVVVVDALSIIFSFCTFMFYSTFGNLLYIIAHFNSLCTNIHLLSAH